MDNAVYLLTLDQVREAIREELQSILADLVESPAEVQDKFLNVKEAAELCHISIPTLYRNERKGLIRGTKIGGRKLFSQAELMASIQKGG